MIVARIPIRSASRWRILCQSTTTLRTLSISRMLDMGGAPSAGNDQSLVRTVNISKNSKLQAVAFDFEVLTRTPDPANLPKQEVKDSSEAQELASVQPDLEQIEQIASLLKVSVDTGQTTAKKNPKKKELRKTQPHEDIRAKYASKLNRGLAGIELAKSQVHDNSKAGDAAGHLAARKNAMKDSVSSTKWMALSGTGKMLSYLTHRSIKIALLPHPKVIDPTLREERENSMQEFCRQLSQDVVIDCVVELDKRDEPSLTRTLQNGVLDKLDVHPNNILVVSDRDDYLKAARDLGMLTCRLQQKNKRRGNITTNYTTPSITDVQEVVNEINGISFNVVLNR